MVPDELRVKRSKTVEAVAPAGTSFCAGCQSFRDVEDFGKGATKCRACVSATTHAARVEKVYGIDAAEYARLLKLQGGKCAICRARPRSKRLAVDHDHQTGAVRGLLCAGERGCNRSLLGGAHDSISLISAAWHYLNTPPTSGGWVEPERQAMLETADTPRPAPAPELVTSHGTGAPNDQPGIPTHMQSRWQMVGSGRDPERGRYLVYIDRQDTTAVPPF